MTEGGDVVRADPTTGEVVSRFATGVAGDVASFADDGTALITGRDGRLRLVVPDGEFGPVPRVGRCARRDDLGGRVACGCHRARGCASRRPRPAPMLHFYPHRGAVTAAISSDDRRVAHGRRRPAGCSSGPDRAGGESIRCASNSGIRRRHLQPRWRARCEREHGRHRACLANVRLGASGRSPGECHGSRASRSATTASGS